MIGKEFLQNCGKILKVIKKSTKQTSKREYFWECEFVDCNKRVLATKWDIEHGSVPFESYIEFRENLKGKSFLQNCGDILIVGENIKREKNKLLYEVNFQKYPYQTFAVSSAIKKGQVLNPQIEQVEFVDKLWPQSYGEFLKPIKKSNKQNNKKEYLWECEFIKYPCKIYALKVDIKRGFLVNPALPWKSRESLYNFLKENFSKKPTLQELYINFSDFISLTCLKDRLEEFNLKDEVIYYSSSSIKEDNLRKYCISLEKSFLKESVWNVIKNREIDIYSPKLKLGIEFNGDYWHSDKICYKYKGMSSKEADLLKYNLAKEKGIDLYFIWEHDWENRPEVVKRYLRIIINKQLRKFNKN